MREYVSLGIDTLEGEAVAAIVEHMAPFVPPTKLEPSYIESNGALIENPKKKARTPAPKLDEEMAMH